MIWSKVKRLSSGQHFLHHKSMGKFFITQRRVTPKWKVQSSPKSNTPEILWLSSRYLQVWWGSDQLELCPKYTESPFLALWVNNCPIPNLAILTNIFIWNFNKPLWSEKLLNSLKDIWQNYWTMKYRSLTYIHSFRSMFVSLFLFLFVCVEA